MSISSYRFIDPRTLATIHDLALLAKTVVDGFMLGKHLSPKPGAGLEFNQYRSYQPGDDLRRVDWKLFARSDRYYVRESEIETNIVIRFVLDCSASMQYEENKVSKFDYARYVTASLGYLAHKQGDGIGLISISDETFDDLIARSDHQHLHRFLNRLETNRSAGIWPDWARFESVFTRSHNRQLFIVISDLYERADEIRKTITKLVALKNEVILFQIMGRSELDLDFEGSFVFEDLESGDTVELDTTQLKIAYRKKIRADLKETRQFMHDHGVDYELLMMDQPLDFALQKFLLNRERRF